MANTFKSYTSGSIGTTLTSIYTVGQFYEFNYFGL